MIKKQKPNTLKMAAIPQFPHCDQRVLHAPGECEYCDRHPDWKQLRLSWGICFTGYEPEEGELRDPATVIRPLDTINKWPGNRPYDHDKDCTEDHSKRER